MFIGRWQPFHDGHKWLIDNKLKKDIPVLIMVRDIPPDLGNPFTTEQTVNMIKKVYKDQDVHVMVIPDIESVNYGRGVGYEINEFIPPEDIKRISATSIREQISEDNDDWRKIVDSRIQEDIIFFLSKR